MLSTMSADPRRPAAVLAACSLVLLLVTFSHSWATGRGDRFSIGPLGVESCMAGACRDLSWSEAGLSTSVAAFGVMSLIGGVAAGLAGLVFGGLVLVGRRRLPRYAIGYAAYGAAAMAIVMFALRLLSVSKQTSIDWAAALAVLAAIAGLVMLRRLARAVPRSA
jgi:hypothetical protein